MSILQQIDHRARAVRDVTAGYLAFKPPRRMSVVEGIKQNLVIKQPGGVSSPWNEQETPYMAEPANLFASRRHEAVVFVGPARTGKTAALLLGGMTHAVCNDPGDMLFVQMTKDKAREFSKTDVDRAIRHSPNLRAMLGGTQDDNTYDKSFRNGMWVKIGWPTIENLSGSTYRYVLFTDYDRMPDDIDGEGSGFVTGLKRVQTYMSRGMCVVESSPGRPFDDPNWRPATAHEAPPTMGVLGIYNQSDRRRFYWKCPDCDDWFEASPGLKLFGLPEEDTLLEIVREANIEAIADEHNRIICPHCGCMHGPKAKYGLNIRGRWVQDGLILTNRDELVGERHDSNIAGFWLGGVAAAYQSWRSLVLRYLQGLREYALNGSELALQSTTNTDQGMPYMSMLLKQAAKTQQDPADRAEKEMERYVVPEQTRFLVASVDVQGGTNAKFVVQVHAVGPNREKWVIDRYNISMSRRQGVGDKFAPIDPASYVEDWDLITEKVVRATYKTPLEGKELRVRMTVVDSGGEEGVTDNAYAWFRRARKEGLESRIMLVKGVGRDQKAEFPFIKLTMKGARNPKEKGDVPVYLLNSNALKDVIETGRRRRDPGPGFIHVPGWLPRSWWDEFYAEVRNQRGIWEQIRKRNEAFDLAYYCEAGCMRLAADRFDWDAARAPHWARPLEHNSDLITVEQRREEREDYIEPTVVEARPTARAVRRQRSTSSYLGRG